MSEQTCERCNKLFKDHNVVRAVVLTHFVALKSKRVYALAKPFECEKLEHEDCLWPDGMPDE